MSSAPTHPDAGDIYRHRWTVGRKEVGYPEETRTESIARLFRAELHNQAAGFPGVAEMARAERHKLLGKKQT